MLAVSWLSYTESEYSFRQDNYRLEIAFILTALITFGWLMSMLVGITFDLFPITHDSKAYTQTHSNQYLLVNIIGQLLIIGGIFTNDLEKVTISTTLYSSILTPQGKYLFDFFILKFKDSYLLECEKRSTEDIIKLLNFYKLRSKVDIINISEELAAVVISLEKFKEINSSDFSIGKTTTYRNDPVYIDSRNSNLNAKLISKLENMHLTIKKLNLTIGDKKKYYNKSFELGIPQINLDKLREKVFGIENNLDELNGIDFKKGCYIGQENTSRIKLRNKLRRRILPIKKISGELNENDIIRYKNIDVGKIMIKKPYTFGLIKVVDPDLKEFVSSELDCGKSKIKILKPNWV